MIGAFASATQDVVIDAWRIDVADEQAPVEILSSIYQFGYRIAALIGGALALVLSERVSWPTVYAIMGGFMALTVIATLFAPDTPRDAIESEQSALRRPGAIDPRLRAIGLAIVGAGWAVGDLDGRQLHGPHAGGAVDPATGKPPAVGDFTKIYGPWIVAATVILPAIVAAVFNWLKAARRLCPDGRRAGGERRRARRRPCLFGADPAAWRAGAAHRLGRDHRPRADPQLPHHRQYLGLVRLPLLPPGAEIHRRRGRLRVEDFRRVHDHGRDRDRRASCSRRSGGCRPC